MGSSADNLDSHEGDVGVLSASAEDHGAAAGNIAGAHRNFIVEVEVATVEVVGVKVLGHNVLVISHDVLDSPSDHLVTSVVAALRGNSDIAVGNVTGSNIANLLLVMGGPALVSSISYDAAYNLDLALVAVFSLALVGFAYVGRRHEMSRVNGVIFVVLYAAYIAASVLR